MARKRCRIAKHAKQLIKKFCLEMKNSRKLYRKSWIIISCFYRYIQIHSYIWYLSRSRSVFIPAMNVHQGGGRYPAKVPCIFHLPAAYPSHIPGTSNGTYVIVDYLYPDDVGTVFMALSWMAGRSHASSHRTENGIQPDFNWMVNQF